MENWKMDKSELDEIAQEVGITLPSDMSLPFKDEWGSRLGIMGFLTGLGIVCFIWIKFRPKTKILPPLYASSNKNNSANLIFRQHYKIKTINGLNVKWTIPIPAIRRKKYHNPIIASIESPVAQCICSADNPMPSILFAISTLPSSRPASRPASQPSSLPSSQPVSFASAISVL
jgi:hypothetical protein